MCLKVTNGRLYEKKEGCSALRASLLFFDVAVLEKVTIYAESDEDKDDE